jgi:quercetin dioxygenase-like cupin family protein
VFADEHQGLEVFEYVMDETADLDVWYAHDGRKVLHLVSGRLTVEFEGHPAAHLGPGDCVVHTGRIPHRWTVCGPDTVRLFLVIVRDPT